MNPSLRLVVLGGFINTRMDCSELFNRTSKLKACLDPKNVRSVPIGEREKTRLTTPNELAYLYIDKFALLCPGGDLASCAVEGGGEPLFYDQHHLSFGFAQELGRRIAKKYSRELSEIGFPET